MDTVEIYRNLHQGCFSVRHRGKVIAHRGFAFVDRPQFVVRPGGRAKVLATKRKNVHAFVRGELSRPAPNIGSVRSVRYNPYESDMFLTEDGSGITEAPWAWLCFRNGHAEIWVPA